MLIVAYQRVKGLKKYMRGVLASASAASSLSPRLLPPVLLRCTCARSARSRVSVFLL